MDNGIIETILAVIKYTFVLVFGIKLSVDFSGVQKTKKNRTATFILLFVLLVVQFVCGFTLGIDLTWEIYPLITHLATVLFLVFYFKRPWLTSLVSLFSAYLCCQIPRWFASLALAAFGRQEASLLVYTLCIFPTLYFLERYAMFPATQLTCSNTRSVLLFGAIPCLYYVFDYAAAVYTNILYDGLAIAVQFIPSITAMLYFVFITIYYSEQRRCNQAESETQLMQRQIEEAKRQIDMLQSSQQQFAVYRHDLRHQFSLLYGLLSNGDVEKAKEYLEQEQANMARITPMRYCENNAANLILSSFFYRANSAKVALTAEVVLPAQLDFPESELCSVLSNGLENAIFAAKSMADSALKKVYLSCKISDNKLLIYIENPYSGTVIIEDGLPKASGEGHGFGTKSMALIAAKRKGYCICEADKGVFVLRVVLPLGP